jgi:nucleoside-diphosphate-sugar epimerase
LKTLVTGATGFIGTYLVRTLVEQGKDVRCLVRKNSDTKPLKELGVELFVGDITSRDSLKGAAKGVNIVYHLAGEVYSKRCSDYYKINFEGTKKILEECLPENIERFIYLSSIAAVGPNRKPGILLNEQSPCRPIDSYGKSKLESEKLLLRSFDTDGFPVVIVRPPTVYGPSERSKIIKKVFQMVQKGSHLIASGHNHLRSMCYIDNLIQGMIATEHFTSSIGQIYFFADKRPYRYNEIFQAVAQEMGIVLKETHLPGWTLSVCGVLFKLLSRIDYYSLPLFVAWHMVLEMACDIRKAKEQLNYKPRIDIKEGIKKTVRYYLEKNSIKIF